MLAMLKCLTCLLAWVFGVLVCPFSFTFEKLNFKNAYMEKFSFLQNTFTTDLSIYNEGFLQKKLTVKSR